MSRIGKLPIELPESVTVKVSDGKVTVTGPKGVLEQELPRQISLLIKDGQVLVEPKGKGKKTKALHGTIRSLLANMVKGVTEGWKKQLELVGTGYRGEVVGKDLVLAIGFSHPVKITAPEGISFKVEKSFITVEGIDKQLVGQVAAKIRAIRPPEPYKGKGIRYAGEEVRRKPGKAAKTQGVGG